MDTPTQVVDLRVQSAMTSDSKDMAVGGALQYRITDIQKAICDVQDLDKSLATIGLGIITEFVNSRTVEDCCHNIPQLKEDILRGVRDASRGWGVKIERVFVTDIGHTRNIRLLTSNNTEGEE
jgi:regulator of protease activity HflC (stomatin/prohibitin superfamily)